MNQVILTEIQQKKKRQTEIAKYLDCIFIRINPHTKDFSAYNGLGEIYKFFDFKKIAGIKI